jgi:hypothetical protein
MRQWSYRKMTVTDGSHGDGAALTPLAAGAASALAGGRFWALSDLEEEEEELPLPEKSSIYLSSGTYSESLSSGSARMEKRLEKRRIQRIAALELDPSSFQIKNSVLSSPMPVKRKLKLPVLEPSVFVLESFNAEEWVRIHRRKMKHVLPRRSMGSHRFTAISRDHRRSPQSIPSH